MNHHLLAYTNNFVLLYVVLGWTEPTGPFLLGPHMRCGLSEGLAALDPEEAHSDDHH